MPDSKPAVAGDTHSRRDAGSSSDVEHPPKAPLVFRVGVTGHRPDPDKGRPVPDVARLRLTVHAILQHIADAVEGVAHAHGDKFDLAVDHSPSSRGTLRLVSALAEGADQWMADEALRLGYQLQCALPFAREEYTKDFDEPTVKDEFQRLLDRATAVFELDGQVDVGENGARKPSSAAYEAVGRAVLNQADLLLAVWDGLPPQGRGGTGAVVQEALQRGIPVVWVAWSSPDTWTLRQPVWRLLQRPADVEGDAEQLKTQVRELILPPEETDTTERGRSTTTLRTHYFTETQKRGNPILGCWPVFLWLTTGEIATVKRLRDLVTLEPFRVREFQKATREDWLATSRGTLLDPERPHPAAPGLAAAIEQAYLRHYAWANLLSVYNAGLYRSAFLVAYLLAAFAVFFALFATAAGLTHYQGIFFTGFELVFILAILGLTGYGRHRHWHERWIDYRMLAERLRLARCLALLGGGGQQASLAAHLATFGNPAATWMHWHYRAIERAAGLPTVSLTKGYLEAARQFWITNLIEDQIEYHHKTGDRYTKMERTLHVARGALFAATLVACGLHLLASDDSLSGWLIFLSAFLPALAAALSAIRTQGEALRLARRSQAMEKGLEQIKLDLASVPTRDAAGHSQRLRLAADRVTELMVREMLDWRVVLLDRPLETHI